MCRLRHSRVRKPEAEGHHRRIRNVRPAAKRFYACFFVITYLPSNAEFHLKKYKDFSHPSRTSPDYSHVSRNILPGTGKKFYPQWNFKGKWYVAGEQSGPRIVDCPIDTILGEIKGEASLTRVLPATRPCDKAYFRPRQISYVQILFLFRVHR